MQALLVDRPFLYPGRDIHGGQTGPTIDMCVEIRGHGRVYLSASAIKVAARALKYPSPERHEKLQRQAAEQRTRIAELEAQLAEALADKVVKVADLHEWLREPEPEPVGPQAA